MALPGFAGASIAAAVQSRHQGASSSSSAPAPKALPLDTAVSSLEAALEAWAACQPQGYILPAAHVPEVLPAIRSHVPTNWVSPDSVALLAELFEGSEGPPVFQQLLKIRGDQVHFLDFWRAFSKAAHLLTSLLCDGIALDEGLTIELETVRDGILRLLEVPDMLPCEAAGSGGVAANSAAAVKGISAAAMSEALTNAAAMSREPDFWREAQLSLQGRPEREIFEMEDLGEVFLSWLQDAIMWQNRETPIAQDYTVIEHLIVDREPVDKPGVPVFLHIYDVSQEDSVRKLNKFLAHRYSPLKFGGVFHAGVEVNGLEWSYGMSQSETLPGLSNVLPKSHPFHRYRQTVELRRSKLTAEEIADLISLMAEEYPGHDYHLLRRNCCHFADDFCRRIGAGGIPGWVHRLARVGANLDTVMHKVMNRRLLDESDSD